MEPPFLALVRCRVPVWLLVAVLACPGAARPAGSGDKDAGPRLLQARLPAGTSIEQADCDQLVRAVRAATLAHHQAAESILSAALATFGGDGRPAAESRRACPCVTRIFRAAVNAAPDHARTLLEAAEALCPDCADGLTEALRLLSDKNVVDDKNVVADPRQGGAGPAGANNTGNTGSAGVAGDPGTAGSAGNAGDPGSSGDPNAPGSQGLSPRDFQGIDVATAGTGNATGIGSSISGFGVGLGAEFPGSPGFSGSTASGGYALPLPVAATTTPVANR